MRQLGRQRLGADHVQPEDQPRLCPGERDAVGVRGQARGIDETTGLFKKVGGGQGILPARGRATVGHVERHGSHDEPDRLAEADEVAARAPARGS